jgi:hypothetical protein
VRDVVLVGVMVIVFDTHWVVLSALVVAFMNIQLYLRAMILNAMNDN